MKKVTERALRASIAHWERNAVALLVSSTSVGPKNCALCQRFNPCLSSGECTKGTEKCPVFEKTGMDSCYQSPYVAADNLHDFWRRFPADSNAAAHFRSAAVGEVAFLKGLLP